MKWKGFQSLRGFRMPAFSREVGQGSFSTNAVFVLAMTAGNLNIMPLSPSVFSASRFTRYISLLANKKALTDLMLSSLTSM